MSSIQPKPEDSKTSFHYRFPLNADEWNRARTYQVPTGFYFPLEVSFVGNVVTIPPISGFEILEIQGKEQYRCSTNNGLLPSNIDLDVSPTNNYIVIRLDVQPNDPNTLPTFMSIPYTQILDTDLIIGKCIYVGATLTSIDYAGQSISLLTRILDSFKSFKVYPIQPTPSNQIIVKGGNLNGREIPLATFTIDFTARTITHEEITSIVGTYGVLVPGESLYVHTYIDDIDDRIKISLSPIAVSPVKPTDYPYFNCGYFTIYESQDKVEFKDIENPDNYYNLIKQGSGNNFDSDKLDGADKSVDINDDDDVTIWTTNLVRKYIANTLINIVPQAPVIDVQEDGTLDPSASPSDKDRYIILDKNTIHANFGTIDKFYNGDSATLTNNDIVEFITEFSEFRIIRPSEGFYLKVLSDTGNYANKFLFYNGTIWEDYSVSVSHDKLLNVLQVDPADTNTDRNKHVSNNDLKILNDKPENLVELSDVNITPTAPDDQKAVIWDNPSSKFILGTTGGSVAGGRIDYDYIVTTQSEFETLFGTDWITDGGSSWVGATQSYYSHTVSGCVIPENTKILLKKPTGNTNTQGAWLVGKLANKEDTYNKKNPAYILRNEVWLSSGVIIHGELEDLVTVVPDEGQVASQRDAIRFHTDYKETDIVGVVDTNNPGGGNASTHYTTGTDNHLTSPDDNFSTQANFVPATSSGGTSINLYIGNYHWSASPVAPGTNQVFTGSGVGSAYGEVQFSSEGAYWQFPITATNGLKTFNLPQLANGDGLGGYFEYYYDLDAFKYAFYGKTKNIYISQNGSVYDDVNFTEEHLVVRWDGEVGFAGMESNIFKISGDVTLKYKVGEILYYDKSTDNSKNPIRKISSIVDNGSGYTLITVDSDIDITSGTTGNIFSLAENIEFNYFTWDGRGNVNGMGGVIDHTSLVDFEDVNNFNTQGGVFRILYGYKFKFNCKVINVYFRCYTTKDGLEFKGFIAYGLGAYDIEFKKVWFIKIVGSNVGISGFLSGLLYNLKKLNVVVSNIVYSIDFSNFEVYGGIINVCHNYAKLTALNILLKSSVDVSINGGISYGCYYSKRVRTFNLLVETYSGYVQGTAYLLLNNADDLYVSNAVAKGENIIATPMFYGTIYQSDNVVKMTAINCVAGTLNSGNGDIANGCSNIGTVYGNQGDLINCTIKGKTISTSAPSGGIDNDVWYQV